MGRDIAYCNTQSRFYYMIGSFHAIHIIYDCFIPCTLLQGICLIVYYWKNWTQSHPVLRIPLQHEEKSTLIQTTTCIQNMNHTVTDYIIILHNMMIMLYKRDVFTLIGGIADYCKVCKNKNL